MITSLLSRVHTYQPNDGFYNLLEESRLQTSKTLVISHQPIQIITSAKAALINRIIGIWNLVNTAIDIATCGPIIRSVKFLAIPFEQGFSCDSLTRAGLGIGLALYITALRVAIAAVHIIFPEALERIFHLTRHFLTCHFWDQMLPMPNTISEGAVEVALHPNWRSDAVQQCAELAMGKQSGSFSQICIDSAFAAFFLAYLRKDHNDLWHKLGGENATVRDILPFIRQQDRINITFRLQQQIRVIEYQRQPFHALVTQAIMEALRKANERFVENGLYSREAIQTMKGKPYYGAQHQAIIEIIDSYFSIDGKFETPHERALIAMPTEEILRGSQYLSICPFGSPLSLRMMKKIKSTLNEIYELCGTEFSKQQILSFIQLRALFDQKNPMVKNALEGSLVYTALSSSQGKLSPQKKKQLVDKVKTLLSEVNSFQSQFVNTMIDLNSSWIGRDPSQIQRIFLK